MMGRWQWIFFKFKYFIFYIFRMARQNAIISKKRREKVQKTKAASKKDEKTVKKKTVKLASEAEEKEGLLGMQ